MTLFMNQTVRQRLIFSFFLLAVLMAGAGTFSVYNLNQLNTNTEKILSDQQPILTDMAAITSGTLFHSLKVDQYVSTGNKAHIRTIEVLEKNIDTLLTSLEKRVQEIEDKKIIKSVRHAYDTYMSLSNELRTFYRNNPDAWKPIDGRQMRIAALLENSLQAKTEAFYRINEKKTDTLIQSNRRLYRIHSRLAVISGLIFSFLAVLLGYVISRSIVNPITHLVETAQKVAKGDMTARAQIRAENEIGFLAENFNSMTGQLQGLIENLEQKVVERTYQLSEERNFVNTILDTAGALITVIYRDGRIVRFNRACEYISGYTFEEVKGRSIWDLLVVEEERDAVKSIVFDFQPEQSANLYENHFITRDGTRLLVAWSAALAFNEDHSEEYIIASGIDITRIRQTEESLKRSEEKFRSIIENAGVGILLIGTDSFHLDINPSFCQMTGFSRDELIGSKIPCKYWPEDLTQKLTWELSQFMKTGTTKIETYFLRKNQDRFPVSLIGSSIFDHTGQPIAFIVIVLDITEKRKMEEEILRVQKLESIGTLAGGIAHDFNNLISIVQGYTELSQMHIDPGNEIYNNLNEVCKACRRAKALTGKFITFSKGGISIKNPGSLIHLIEDATNLALSGSNARGIFNISEDLWEVKFDQEQMKQAIYNLITNAREAVPKGGIIKVAAENVMISENKPGVFMADGKYVKISIQDRGPGIPEENLSFLFDPYYSTKQRGDQKGMGLGLTTTYSIIKRHEGYIFVNSEQGAGTTFEIYLPALEINPEKKVSIKKTANLENETILVMDDEPGILDIACKMLKRIGYAVQLAENGNTAVALYKKAMDSGNPIDIVILDLTVKGGMGGKDTISQLLTIDPGVTAIVSSGYHDDPIMMNFRKYGFKYAISKPYEMKELRKLLNEITSGLKV
ncbi:MAG: PAS domain S-box protein [Proteobacteria bacterium]|nr:PAS domain S-box protein [Pseudomonadota bacterium]MBU1584698.1 PAS domain S-box protein [Pseudomonadota bacterium]MBU2629817.1 PAS domain S-box protein [Pseudomonadota bacterium]